MNFKTAILSLYITSAFTHLSRIISWGQNREQSKDLNVLNQDCSRLRDCIITDVFFFCFFFFFSAYATVLFEKGLTQTFHNGTLENKNTYTCTLVDHFIGYVLLLILLL